MIKKIAIYIVIAFALFGLITIFKQFNLIEIYGDENEAGIKLSYGFIFNKGREIVSKDGDIIEGD